MNIEKLKQIPKPYYVIAVMAIIVFGILIFGGGSEALQQKDLTSIEFKLSGFEELIDEDGQNESITLTTADFKAKISIDPVDINNYDGFIGALKDGKPDVKAKIMTKDKELLNQDEIIQAYQIEVNGVSFSNEEAK